MTASGPLEGLTILDLTRVLSGPYCTMLLADMGARVIKIEQPGRGDETRTWGPPFVAGESTYFLCINRNKESITLDFKSPEGRALLEQLIDRSDVVVENFRPGTLARIGLGHGEVRATRPRLIYCSISGFGQTGPRREEPGYDAVIQAEGGLMSVTGASDGPPFRLGVAVADLVAGLLAFQGIVLALYARERRGQGQYVDISMLDGVVSLLSYQASAFLNAGMTPARMGNRHPTISPYDTFSAADGDFFLAVGNDEQFRRLCAIIGRPELATDARYATNPDRVVNYDALREELTRAFQPRTRASWIEALTASGVPSGAVRTIAEVLNDPQVLTRGMIQAVEHASAGTIKLLGTPVSLSDTPARIRSAPPLLGQHTDAILQELRVPAPQVTELRARGVI